MIHQECFICFHPINYQEQSIFHLKCCNNYLHTACFKQWLKYNSSSCMICNKLYKYNLPPYLNTFNITIF